MNPADQIKQAVKLRKAGKAHEGVQLLRAALRLGGFTGEQIDKAGRFIGKQLKEDCDAHRVLMVGQCTTTWLANGLAAQALGRGMPAYVIDGEYDNVMQELLTAASSGERIDSVVFVPWHQRLLSGSDRSPADRVADELAFWQQAWQIAANQLKARIIQVGYDCIDAGPFGVNLSGEPDGPTGLMRAMDRALREALPKGAYFVDLQRVAGQMGRDQFYDARRYHWTKQPFSEEGTSLLSYHLAAALRAVTTGPKKVLVLDLDNTLWGGVVGETGPLGISVGETADGEAYRSFQKYAKGLAERGVVLAVCSKNNPDDAREPFGKHPDMVLTLDDFAAFEASWDPKPLAIERIAKTLRLGLDSFVFVDDNPAEREHVRQVLPEVEVVEVPEDAAGYIRAVEAGLYFEAVEVSGADRQRAEQYTVERKRRDAEQSFASIDDYLASLEMIADVRDIDETDMQRVVQLLGKTNQFNLTTRRHTAEDVRAMLAQVGAVGMTLRLSDKFGDHGLVCLVIAVPNDEQTLRIDTWLMSCRVINRTAEQFMFSILIERALQAGIKTLEGEFIPTAKNKLVADLYDRLGFKRMTEDADGSVVYTIDLTDPPGVVTHIKTAEAVRG